MDYKFEWDVRKAIANKRKHNVSFESAATIFLDPLALSIFDSQHSDFEERWITMGVAGNKDILVVVPTYEDINNDAVAIRIISARRATKKERKDYQG